MKGLSFETGLWPLPPGWSWARIEKVAPINPKRWHPGAPSDEVVFLRMAAVEEKTGRVETSQRRPAAEVRNGFSRFRSGDVLFAKITPCMENGKIAVVPTIEPDFGAGSTEFHVLEPAGVRQRYLFYWLVRDSFREQAAFNMTGTAGQKRVPRDFLKNALIPMASPEVQDRIVARIDELFAEIDDGEEELRRARQELKTYRKSLLKAAVTGDLTADWRATNPAGESGEVFLGRILADRRERWGSHPKGKGKRYKEPVSPKVGLPRLPESWAWATIEQICSSDRPVAYGVLQPGNDVSGGTQLIRVMDIADGDIQVSQLKRILPKIADAYPRTKLQGGEVLLTVVGSIGRTALVPNELAGANTARAVAMLPIEHANAEWIEFVLRYEPYRFALESASHEVARKTLNLEDVRAFPIPLPPRKEQAELVRQIKAEIEAERTLRDAKQLAQERSKTLRQSILAAAFRGELIQ